MAKWPKWVRHPKKALRSAVRHPKKALKAAIPAAAGLVGGPVGAGIGLAGKLMGSGGGGGGGPLKDLLFGSKGKEIKSDVYDPDQSAVQRWALLQALGMYGFPQQPMQPQVGADGQQVMPQQPMQPQVGADGQQVMPQQPMQPQVGADGQQVMPQQPMQRADFFGPIEEEARSKFQQETVPSIAERFTAMGSGGQRSSAFQHALGSSGADLERKLAALKAAMQQQQMSQLMQIGLRPRHQIQLMGGQPGIAQGLAANPALWGALAGLFT